MKMDITPETKAALTDPHLELLYEALVDSKEFKAAVMGYVACELGIGMEDHNQKWLNRSELAAVISEEASHADETIRELQSEERGSA